nr:IclR family transcriptional regulator C-terminal domain-containing protein [Klebsiella pneumoniae]
MAKSGYALDFEEAEEGLNCLALPLRQHGLRSRRAGNGGPFSSPAS